jgi:hypothetical protein
MGKRMNPINFQHLTHLPYCQAMHVSLQHPIKFKLCTESFLSVPKSVVVDGIISYGGSTGIGLNLARKAYGEFFERNHLFTAVPIHSQKTLKQVFPDEYRNKLINICQYNKNNLDNLLNHYFSFTTVNHLFSDSTQDYFFNAICLNGVKEDTPYINFTDSCACAVHPNKEKAIYNALMEFLERQALLGSWLSKTYRYAIHPSVLKEVTPYRDLVTKLLENGELYIIENGNYLPGYTVMMFYFSHSEKDVVQYSVGSSSGLSLNEALTAALEELYQCYTFLYNTEASVGLENKAGAGYHLSFQQCNHQATKAIIPFIQEALVYKIHKIHDINTLKVFTYDEILTELANLSESIYYYYFYEKQLGLHFIKIMSPDFFSHMSLKNSLNIDNIYAKKLNITSDNAYLEKIPFP